MRISINVYMASAPSGGMAAIVALLRSNGARRIGSTSVTRAPIELVESDWLRHAARIEVAGDEWSAFATSGPAWTISVRGLSSTERARDMLASLVTIGAVDFAVCQTADDHVQLTDLEPYRDELIAFTDSMNYQASGPAGLALLTYIGPRVRALLDDASRRVLEDAGTLHHDVLRIQRTPALQDTFIASGLPLQLVRTGDAIRVSRGPRWMPFGDGSGPDDYQGTARKLVERLQSVRVDDGDPPVKKIAAKKLVAPFAMLASTSVEGMEIDVAVLPFSELSGARMRDVDLAGADLRGSDARGSEWIESTLAAADLRWSTFARSRMAMTRLDQAKCDHIDLTDAQELDTASGACFDNATALRWAPKGALLRGATFRQADLRNANFEKAILVDARFDGADLRHASFRGADLSGAVFTGANLADADLTGAKTEGTVFES